MAAPGEDGSVADLAATPDDLKVAGTDLKSADLSSAAQADLVGSVGDLPIGDLPAGVTDLVSGSADLAPSNTVTWSGTEGLPSSDCAPWTLLETADTETPTLASGVMTLTTSPDGEFMFYNQGDAELITPATLVIEARVRFVSGSSTNTARTVAAVGFRIGANRKRNTLYIADGEIFLLSDASTKGNAASVATKDALHTYRIEVDTSTGAIAVLRDGTPTLTGSTFEVADSLTPTILFGDANGSAGGTTEWASVSHNAHTPISCP